jgi:hypothetical protein
MSITALLDVTPCSVAVTYRRFEGICCLIFRVEEWLIFSIGIMAKSYLKMEVESTSEMSFIWDIPEK